MLEHAISDRLLERIDERLGRPRFDPHGDAIPDAAGHVASRALRAARRSRGAGHAGRVLRVSDRDPEPAARDGGGRRRRRRGRDGDGCRTLRIGRPTSRCPPRRPTPSGSAPDGSGPDARASSAARRRPDPPRCHARALLIRAIPVRAEIDVVRSAGRARVRHRGRDPIRWLQRRAWPHRASRPRRWHVEPRPDARRLLDRPRTPVASSHARHSRAAISGSRVIFAAVWRRGSPREPVLGPQNSPPSIVGSTSARTSDHAPCSLDCVIGACRLSANRVSLEGAVDARRCPGVRPLVEYPGARRRSPRRRRRAQPAVGLESERGRRDLGLHVRPPARVARGQLRVDRIVRRQRRRHAADPHHAAARRGQRREQLAGEREVAEHVGREHDLVPVAGRLARLRRMHDPGVEQQAVEAAAPSERSPPRRAPSRGCWCRAGASRPRGRGIRNPTTDRRARRGEAVRVATGHDDARARAHELLAREVAEARVRPGDEVAATGQVGKVLGIPAAIGSGTTPTLRPATAPAVDRLGACGPVPTSNAG